MKIVFVLPEINLSGGTKVLIDYADYLKSAGHSVVCLVPRPARIGLRALARMIVRGESRRPVDRRRSHLSGRDVDIVEGKVPGRLVESDFPDADVVIATWWETAEWIAPLGPEKGVKVHFIQGHEVFDGQPVDRVEAVYRLDLKRIVVAQWLQDVMRDSYGCSDAVLVPNGVRTGHFAASASGTVRAREVGLVWSNEPIKNCAMAIAAMDLARQHMPDLRLVAFGSEPCPGELARQDWVEYFERPAQSLIPQIYARARLWLFPTLTEGFGLPILEALACGTPVVATAAGAAPQIVSDRNGRLVETTPSAMAEAMVDLLRLPEQR
ncbi:MAG TPA: glycosyltransferase family 4 protein, partial [Novosphingobium sp.]